MRKEISKADKDVEAMSEWFDHKKKRKAEQEQQQHVEFEKEMQELKLKNKKQLKEMEVVNVDEEEGPKTKPYSKLPKIEIESFMETKWIGQGFGANLWKILIRRNSLQRTNFHTCIVISHRK